MKKNMLLFLLMLVTWNSFAEGVYIYAPVAQNILIDKNNYLRYSPINLFDNKPDTVYAVAFTEIDKNKPLLELYFSEPAVFDTLSIKAGYFDERYFEKNNRIKKLHLRIFNCRNTESDTIIDLADKMIEQPLYQGETVKATKIEIYIQDIFPGTKWNDLVISDLKFYIDNKHQTVSFDEGQCIYPSTIHSYEYDTKDRLIYEHAQYGKAGANDHYYKYEHGTIYRAYVGMDDDPNDLKYEEIKSIEQKNIKGKEFFYKDGIIIAEKFTYNNTFYISQYMYNNKNQVIAILTICENTNWSDKFIKFLYNEKGLLIEKIGYEDATIYTSRYE